MSPWISTGAGLRGNTAGTERGPARLTSDSLTAAGWEQSEEKAVADSTLLEVDNPQGQEREISESNPIDPF